MSDGISNDLQTLGDDIEILPPSTGKGMRTVMKFEEFFGKCREDHVRQ